MKLTYSPASPFARKDISVDQIATRTSDADYALACRRDILRPDFYPQLEIVHRVEVDGVTLAIVKQK